jgi:hypothetical protein
MYSISINTQFGATAFSFDLSPEGEVSDLQCLSLGLPEAVLKLTYDNPDLGELKNHFQYWMKALPYIVELAVWEEEVPGYLVQLRDQFKDSHSGYADMRSTVLATDILDSDNIVHLHWTKVTSWIKLGFHQTILNLPTRLNRKETTFTAGKLSLPYRELAAEWLMTTFPLAPLARINDWVEAIGKTRTNTANEFLFSELERPGYLPYAKQIFTTLANSRLKINAGRIISLYNGEDNIKDAITAYIHLLNQLPFPKTFDLLVRIVAEHPRECLGALKRIYRHDPALGRKVIRDLFLATDDYRTLAAMLRYAVELDGLPVSFISLAEINTRLSESAFLDDAQVTWQQKLSEGWQAILLTTPPQYFTEILAEHKPDAKGRVARNLLLQLKEYLSNSIGANFQLPDQLQPVLLNLLHSRYDKVSTVATDVIRVLLPQLINPEAAVMALLNHLEWSKYRLMDSAALKAAAELPGMAEFQEVYLKKRITQLAGEAERANFLKMLSYVKFLPGQGELVDRI